MSNLSISKATDDVLKAYDIKWDRFNPSVLKDVYDSIRLKDGEMPDKDEFNSLLAIQFEKYYMEELRVERNKRLTDCDWTQNKDVVLSADDVKVWNDYRQELRDLPDNVELKDDNDILKLLPEVPKQNVISKPELPVKIEVVEIEIKDEDEEDKVNGEKIEEEKEEEEKEEENKEEEKKEDE